jgi:calcium/calmodulin-dependent protein kinase I
MLFFSILLFIYTQLGEGAYAIVNKAIHKTDGKLFAIKIVSRASLDRDTEHALQDEIAILSKLHHEHIMGLYESIVTVDKYYLVTEYLEGGELFDRIVEKAQYTENEARNVCAVLFDTMRYIQHSVGIAHRDLKPENLLLAYRHSDLDTQSDSNIKIADFGFAKVAGPHNDSCATMCGTPGYLAPEVIRKVKYGTQCDMWSMGVIVYILLAGYPPFYGSNPKIIFEKTLKGQIDFDSNYWAGITTSAKDMIRSLLDLDPTKRATAEQILSHP